MYFYMICGPEILQFFILICFLDPELADLCSSTFSGFPNSRLFILVCSLDPKINQFVLLYVPQIPQLFFFLFGMFCGSQIMLVCIFKLLLQNLVFQQTSQLFQTWLIQGKDVIFVKLGRNVVNLTFTVNINEFEGKILLKP